jgi:hypothetical protein
MKRLLFVVLALAFCAGFAMADLSGSASCHVRVIVDPNVTMGAVASTVDAGSVQTGDFTATCVFRVDANKQIVSFYAEASPLYKGNDPTNSDVAPIPLNLSAGILLQPDNGNAMGGLSNVLSYGTATGVCDGFPTVLTETKAYESSQNNHFSQNVTLVVSWNQDDPEKPMGEYSGCVRLTALLLPESV